MYDYVGGKFFIPYKLKTITLILLMYSIYSMYMKLRLYVLEIVTVLKEQMVQSFLWLLKEHPYFVQCILLNMIVTATLGFISLLRFYFIIVFWLSSCCSNFRVYLFLLRADFVKIGEWSHIRLKSFNGWAWAWACILKFNHYVTFIFL